MLIPYCSENLRSRRSPFVGAITFSFFKSFSSFYLATVILAASFVLSLPRVLVAQTVVRVPIVNVAAGKKTVIATTTPSTSKSVKAPVRTAKAAPSNTRRKVVASRPRSKPIVRTAQRQVRPTPERYSEIQAALSKEGFFDGTPDGVWGQNSVDALSRFQDAHSVEPTGKVDAKTLILLGLGPKYDNRASAEVAVPSPQQ